MNTTQQLFQQAQLAEAAYAHFDLFGDPKNALMDAGHSMVFSNTQATEFLKQWSVVNHIPDTASGFSATLFKNNQTGEFTLAIRGSMQMVDFTADAGLIVADGIAAEQVIDMYNYWKQLNTPSGASYTAAVLKPVANFQLGQYAASQLIHDSLSGTYSTVAFVQSTTLADATLRTGSGSFTTVPGELNLAGHSLGGHLSMAFTRLFPLVSTTALGINGLGFKLGNSNVTNLYAILGGGTVFDSSRIENAYGIAGPEFASMNNFNLQQPGGWDGLYIESGGLGTVGGHSSVQMTDSLAVYDLFIRIDQSLSALSPNAALTKLKPLFEAANSTASLTLESLVKALGKLLNRSKRGQRHLIS